MNKNLIRILKEILAISTPAIQNLIESSIVPILKRKTYERLDDFVNDRIEDLSELFTKIKNTENEAKRKAHIEGFKLGLETLEAIGNKLIKAAKTLKEELNSD